MCIDCAIVGDDECMCDGGGDVDQTTIITLSCPSNGEVCDYPDCGCHDN